MSDFESPAVHAWWDGSSGDDAAGSHVSADPWAAPAEAEPAPKSAAAAHDDARGAPAGGVGFDAQLVASMFGLEPAVEELTAMAPAGHGVGVVLAAIGRGEHDENAITDELYFTLHPDPAHKKLEPGTAEAKEWLRLLTEVVRPALAQHAPAKAQAASAPPAVATQATQPALPASPAPAAPPATGGGASSSVGGGGHDKYFTQNFNSYDDNIASPQWSKLNSAAGNTCNVTSLSMALVNMCGGDENCVRVAALAKLRGHGARPGAVVSIDGSSVSLAKALADDKLANRIAIPDLLTALGIETYANAKLNELGDWSTLAALAKDLGIAHSAAQMKDGSLAHADARKQAKQRLDKGEQIIVHTPHHICYLVDATDEGVIIHDPAGARLLPEGAMFIDSGPAGELLERRWLPRLHNAAAQETARRRLATNPEALAVVEQVIALIPLTGKAYKEAAKKLKAMTGQVEMGANNFYAASECAAYELGVAVDLEANQPKAG
jgi:hypothetical protein